MVEALAALYEDAEIWKRRALRLASDIGNAGSDRDKAHKDRDALLLSLTKLLADLDDTRALLRAHELVVNRDLSSEEKVKFVNALPARLAEAKEQKPKKDKK